MSQQSHLNDSQLTTMLPNLSVYCAVCILYEPILVT